MQVWPFFFLSWFPVTNTGSSASWGYSLQALRGISIRQSLGMLLVQSSLETLYTCIQFYINFGVETLFCEVGWWIVLFLHSGWPISCTSSGLTFQPLLKCMEWTTSHLLRGTTIVVVHRMTWTINLLFFLIVLISTVSFQQMMLRPRISTNELVWLF